MHGQRTMSAQAIATHALSFAYPGSTRGLNELSLDVSQGERLLIVGPNGAGKSTLLKVLAGQKLVNGGTIALFGVDPFDLRAKPAGRVVYLGTEWAANEIVKRDVGVETLVNSIGGDAFPERRDELLALLDISTSWRMNQCSDGQRRRVQLLMGLVAPWDLLLLDEVTIDLDVVVRQRLMAYLQKETELRNATVVYATHIFDGLGAWPDRVLHLVDGAIVEDVPLGHIQFENRTGGVERSEGALSLPKTNSLHPLAISWLKGDPNE